MSIEKDVRNFLNGISENGKIYFDCETDKNPISYKAGEEMIFRLCVKTGDTLVPVPFISVKCAGDDGAASESIVACEDDGYFCVKTCCNTDGFVRVIAKALDENKQLIEGIDVFEGGAGADVDKIRLCTDTPDDYFEFWESLTNEARSIPVKVIYEKDLEAADGFIAKDMRFETTAGKFLSLIVTYPKNAKPGSLKLRMNFLGYGMTSAPLGYSSDSMVIGVNSHDVENGLTAEQYNEIKTTLYQNYGFIAEENKNPRTSYWYKMMLRDMQAFFIFKDHELLNKKDYIFIGGSQGGMQACHLAAHCGYASECYLNVAWCVDLFAIEKEKRMRGWRPDPSVAMNYYDTGLAASYLKCPVYIEAGLGDYVCPPSGQMAMYNAIKAPKLLRFVQNQTHPYRPVIKRYFSLCDGHPNPDFKF